MRAGSAIASSTRHVVGVGLQALLVAAIVAALAFAGSTVVGTAPGGAHTVLAAKGGNGGGNGHGNGAGGGGATTAATIIVADGPFGGTTIASTNVGGGQPVREICISVDGGALVDYRTTDDSGLAVLSLGPTPTWTSGAASCSAALGTWDGNGNWQSVATATFNVY